MRGLGAAALLAAIVSFAQVAEGQARDPSLVWRTVRTEHFEVNYHEPLGVMARRIASIAERALARLGPRMGYRPPGRTQIVISDDTDTANGSASALPYNNVRLFAAAPEDLDELGDYDDWMTELVTHEYTHVLHLDNIGGIPALINRIFGKVYPPNSVLPRWFLEGYAVYEETELTSGGRLRSSLFDMYLRMDALENRLIDLDQISNIADRWPHGNMWYLYGSQFVEYVGHRYGDDALAAMSRDQGSELVPYGLNRMAQRATGRTFIELYDDFRLSVRERYHAQADEVRARGVIEGRRITFHGEEARSPRYLDDGRVVYWAADGRSVGQLRAVDPASGESERVARVGGRGRPAPHPNGHDLVYSGADAHRDFYRFSDLFRVDMRTDEVTRLTRGWRAQEPDVSPDGRWVAFTTQAVGTSHLRIARLEDVEGTARVLMRSRRYEQIYAPRWSPDGRSIVASAWRGGGYRDIVLVDVETGAVRELTRDRAFDSGPVFAPDGRSIYFSSDRTGIANIYELKLSTGALRQVTNVLAGAYQPAISRDGRRMTYLGYTSFGWDLFEMPLDSEQFLDPLPYTSTRPEPSELTGAATLASEAYDPLRTLLPRSYSLSLSQDSFGSSLVVSAFGSDVVGFHSFGADVALSLEHGSANVNLVYDLIHAPIPLHFRAFRTISQRSGLFVEGGRRNWIEQAIGGEIRASYNFATTFGDESVSLSYSLQHTDKEEPFGGNLDPNDEPPDLPVLGWFGTLRAGWSYSNVYQNTYDISASGGHTVTFDIALADPLLGGRTRNVGLGWTFTQFIENPLVRLHVLAMRYAGGISAGDVNERGIFAVGGFSSQNLLDALIENALLGGAVLRGYQPFDRTGSQFHLLQLEYRFPIIRFNRGVSTLPLYFNRLYGAAFADYGDAFFGSFDLSTFRLGIGAQLLADFTIGYVLPFTARVGVARGTSEGGETQVYANLGFQF